MRTNIVIDDQLIEQAKIISGLSTKKEVVQLALEEYVKNKSRKDLQELKGKIEFIDGYDYKAIREGRNNDIG